MEPFVQVHADIPRALKRRAFAAMALRDEKFNRWLRAHLQAWLEEVEGTEAEREGEVHAQCTASK